MSIKLCFFAVLCVVISSILKQIRPDFLPFLRIGTSVVVCVVIVGVLNPLLTYINSLFESTGLSEWGGAILKALGVAFIVQICSDICRDCGESSAASGVELVGKLEIVLLCLPMLEKIIKTAWEVLQW